MVINYDLPVQPKDYLHRVGRLVRFGTEGLAINLVTSDERQLVHDMQTMYDAVFKPCHPVYLTLHMSLPEGPLG